MSRHSAESVKALLDAEPVVQMTCQQLCDQRDADIDELGNIEIDFPVNMQARVRAYLMRDIRSLTSQMEAQNCPPC